MTRAKGRVTGDKLVAALPSEQEAEAMARDLAVVVEAKCVGKRMLADIIGDHDD